MSINLSEMFFITLERIFKSEKCCDDKYFKLSLILLVLLIIGITDHKL